MSQPDFIEQFVQTFEKESATEKWEALRDTMHRTALATFGKRSTKSHYWFKGKPTVMTTVIDAKRATLVEYKHAPSEKKTTDSQDCQEQGSALAKSLQRSFDPTA